MRDDDKTDISHGFPCVGWGFSGQCRSAGVLNKKTGDFIGAVYSADTGKLGTGILIQNSPGASWQYALKYEKDGAVKFAVDGAGAIHINLSTPAKSSSPCATGQLGADRNYVYVCVSPNNWKRSTLSSF